MSDYKTPEEFVAAWQAGESHKDVAAKLGMGVSGVVSRARYYRKKGVKLKSFASGGVGATPLDVDKLNKLIAS
jgi:transposase